MNVKQSTFSIGKQERTRGTAPPRVTDRTVVEGLDTEPLPSPKPSFAFARRVNFRSPASPRSGRQNAFWDRGAQWGDTDERTRNSVGEATSTSNVKPVPTLAWGWS